MTVMATALISPSEAVVNVKSGKTHVAKALRMTKQPKTTCLHVMPVMHMR